MNKPAEITGFDASGLPGGGTLIVVTTNDGKRIDLLACRDMRDAVAEAIEKTRMIQEGRLTRLGSAPIAAPASSTAEVFQAACRVRGLP